MYLVNPDKIPWILSDKNGGEPLGKWGEVFNV